MRTMPQNVEDSDDTGTNAFMGTDPHSYNTIQVIDGRDHSDPNATQPVHSE